ncbi:sulfurtransferase [Streptomyces tubbatahanensis]|uniref:Sulfurtransferase n=1 Tax=Streptomyces tubbatahanensis TaxID=2923272 RepID=A0ABY3XY56_9ACTN|nr:sulfurtransferase [Streptomyces tubbatahanensis]UNS99412.1 sulfurtransferase [Streptomyces tubbatahanensis]
MTAIISAATLASDLAAGSAPALLDVRYKPGDPPGLPLYQKGHLPGAVYIDLESELAAKPAAGTGRHPLPSPDVFGAAMRRAGVSSGRPVVVYDAGGLGGGWAAARCWWLLRWAGHPDVRVLDGGLAAWEAAGNPLSTGTPDPEPGDFTPSPGGMPTLDADEAAALARHGILMDARAAERYRGEVEPLDPVAGHIPGAVSAPTTENLTDAGTFRSPHALTERFEALGATTGAEVGVYCGSGVSAAQEVLALHLAGIDAALYVGSWSEWTAESRRPVATGPERG